MARGRKPLPKAILKLRNSSALRQPRHKRTEPDPPEGKLSCPSFLDREGRAEWRRITKSLAGMGILSPADRGAIAGMAHFWAIFVRTAKAMHGMDSLATKDSRPVAATCSDAFSHYARTAAEFGLTPAARTRVDVDLEGKKLDAFDQFVARKHVKG